MSGPLILKRASASRPSGQWSHEDYDVLADGKAIGRIYEDASGSTPPGMRWFWSITAIVPAVPNVTNGHATTLDETKAKFRAGMVFCALPRQVEPGRGSHEVHGRVP
jgi:hypothetical protein